jgi:hypothetical protein
MSLFRKLFYRKPPDGLLEVSERVYGQFFILFCYFVFKKDCIFVLFFSSFSIHGENWLIVFESLSYVLKWI